MTDHAGDIHLPERVIPVPTSVSTEARSVLAMGKVGPPGGALPALDDTAGWRAYVAERDGFVRSMMAPRFAAFAGTVEERAVGPCTLYVLTPEGVGPGDRRVYLDIHGGAFVLGGGDLCAMTSAGTATNVGARVWSLDYRMAPDHPFPTPLDDVFAAYRTLLDEHRPAEIIVGGSSAGANLAAALLLRAGDEGLPMPAAAVFNSGGFDLTGSGDSWQTNEGLDNLLSRSDQASVDLHAGGQDQRLPYLSPLFGDVSGFPPVILTTGTRDLLLSDNVRMHRRLRAAGVAAELHVWEAAGHGGFLGAAPEDTDRLAELRRFVDERWAGSEVDR